MRKVSILMAAALLAGCNQFLAERMVAPPNEHRVHVSASTQPTADGREFRIPVGPPGASLAAWVLEPDAGSKPRGTILILHGFLNDHSQLESAARALQTAGYRAVLIDLRGHGQSTGAHISFGVQDARDLAVVTTFLQQNHLCGSTVGVFGASYGATSALLFAGVDPRVTTVVAVAPFATLRDEAPHFGRNLLPLPGRFLSDADYTTILALAGKIADFDPDACDAVNAIRKTQAHVRLFHGDLDAICPCEASKQLHAADPERSELTILPGLGHLALCFDPLGTLQKPTREWFDRYLPTPAVAAR